MKKIIFIVMLLLVAAWAGATWLIGKGVGVGVQKFYEQAELQMAESGEERITLEGGEIEGGFLSSSATTDLKLNMAPFNEGENDKLRFNTKIYHGPVMFTPDGVKVGSVYSVSTLDMSQFPDEFQQFAAKAFDDEPPLKIGALFGFNGDVDSTATMPLFRHAKEEIDGSTTVVDFEGFHAEAHGTTEIGSPVNGSFEIGEINVNNETQKRVISVSASAGEIDIEEVVGGIALASSSKFTLPEIKSSNEAQEYTIKDVVIRGESAADVSDNTLGGLGRIEIGSASGSDPGGVTSGLVKQLGDGGYIEFEFKGWDLEALRAMNKQLSKSVELGKQLAKERVAGGADADTAEIEAEIKENDAAGTNNLMSLFRPGFSWDLRTKLGDGETRTDLKLGIGYAKGAPPMAQAKTLRPIVKGLEVDIDLRLGKAILPEGLGEMMLAPQVESGMIEDRGDYYRAAAELKDSKVVVNGNEMPILQMIEPYMDDEAYLQEIKAKIQTDLKRDASASGDIPADMDKSAPGTPTPTPTPSPAPEPATPDAAPQPQ